jgi:endo-1,4-beta-D-glucanase Y
MRPLAARGLLAVAPLVLACTGLPAVSLQPGPDGGGDLRPADAVARSMPEGGVRADAGRADALPERGHPFGSHRFPYPAGAALPSGDQGALDRAVTSFYDRWKAAYLQQACGGTFVLSGGGTGAGAGDEVSEGHGYGMMVTAIMAGHDPEAHALFDGMVRFFRRFPSAGSPDLMGWTANAARAPACTPPGGTPAGSATDGDLDIAFALLLADAQWGSTGPIDYRAEAARVIAAIKAGEISAASRTPLLGDWAAGDQKYAGATRPSDFVLDHFRAFGAATGDPFWGGVVDGTLAVVATLQERHAPQTGLLPDFAVDVASNPAPAPEGFLEGPRDGQVGYNACRIPWRLATDWVASGDGRTRAALEKMVGWVEGKTGGDPGRIIDGYTLAGDDRGQGNQNAFEAPFAVAGIVGRAHQAWVDAAWRRLASGGLRGYYGDSLQLLSMIVLSGNWWVP